VQICLDRSGRARVFSGANDIGQGSNTMLAVIVSEELGLPLDDIRVLSADTDLCPVDLGAYSSRITLMVGNACLAAAQKLRAKVCESVAKRWEVPAKNRVVLAGRMAIDREDPERHVDSAQAFQWAEADHGLLGEVGSYNTPKDRHGDYRGGTIGASPAYSFTAHLAEVEVDAETGVVEVKTIWVAHDCGKALSRRIVEGQIEGSTYMGFGEALMEEHKVDPAHRGAHAGPSLLDYRIPTFLDTPEIAAMIVEAPDANGPYGAKEAGEGPLHSSIPAIANAIYDAVGVRLDRCRSLRRGCWRRSSERRAASRRGRAAAAQVGLDPVDGAEERLMLRLPQFEVESPDTVEGVVAALQRRPGARLVAGGTDILPNLKHFLDTPPVLVSLARVTRAARGGPRRRGRGAAHRRGRDADAGGRAPGGARAVPEPGAARPGWWRAR
jgi:hypothetical protein